MFDINTIFGFVIGAAVTCGVVAMLFPKKVYQIKKADRNNHLTK